MFGVKIILKSYVEDNEKQVFFEELICTVATENEDVAFEKAEAYAKGYCEDYNNCDGKTVKTEIFLIESAFEVYEPENDVQEVYSQYYTYDGKECNREDLIPLLNSEFNAEKN